MSAPEATPLMSDPYQEIEAAAAPNVREKAVAPHFNEGDIVRFAAYGRFTRLIGGGQLLADGCSTTGSPL